VFPQGTLQRTVIGQSRTLLSSDSDLINENGQMRKAGSVFVTLQGVLSIAGQVKYFFFVGLLKFFR